jgi:serine protease Do
MRFLLALFVAFPSTALCQSTKDSDSSFTLTKLVRQIQIGKPWDNLQVEGPLGCKTSKIINVSPEILQPLNLDLVEPIFAEEMRRAGLNVSSKSGDLFGAQADSDIQIAGIIDNQSGIYCLRGYWTFPAPDYTKISGSNQSKIQWQIYSRSQRKVIGSVRTEGSFESKVAIQGDTNFFRLEAYRRNFAQLATSDAFRTILSSTNAGATSAAAAPDIVFTAATERNRDIGDAGRAVATVMLPDGSMGSGFLISTDGYLLTNHHVVESVRQVRLRWSDRSESVADVVRSDSKRDVALLKMSPNGREPLSLRTSPVLAAEPVFAIGTPLDRALQGTITKGIVSASRTIQGQAWIQSDVAVDHGNSGGPLLDEKGRVIGMTAWGYVPDGVSHNLNFFVPIADALRALRLSAAKDEAS